MDEQPRCRPYLAISRDSKAICCNLEQNRAFMGVRCARVVLTLCGRAQYAAPLSLCAVPVKTPPTSPKTHASSHNHFEMLLSNLGVQNDIVSCENYI